MAPRTRGVVKLELASFHNSRGFSGLPTELLHQIVSYMQEALIPWIYGGAMAHWYSGRRDLLRTLCQLCRSLRATFLPLLWERLEACTYTVYDVKKPWGYTDAPSLANDLLGQLKLVMNGKLRYAPYVRVVSVAVFKPNLVDAILKKLARALSLMPNVHTVQLICHGTRTQGMPPLIEASRIQKAFEGYVYPSVRRVVVPHQARSIFACFPQAQHVHMNQHDFYDFSDSVAGVARYCHTVESFGWIENHRESRVSSIVTMLPRLRRLECHITTGKLDEMMELSKLQNLEQITLTFARYLKGEEATAQIIEAARGVLAKSQASQRNKRLIVAYESPHCSVTTYVI
ncbi:hypothetical protein M378DRAFT_159969 [Amanita muscaria Koide BX008]|uniref:F-box domain-containing protein n=1 Tax=Amanita muscaria (strain Koide BX008) TaxID=946122 RepID=A0A0C2XDW7_AMAMK|nr:hypothetical protein M378DRAFT_159969 [Amanita muscaria Koide BX008]